MKQIRCSGLFVRIKPGRAGTEVRVANVSDSARGDDAMHDLEDRLVALAPGRVRSWGSRGDMRYFVSGRAPRGLRTQILAACRRRR